MANFSPGWNFSPAREAEFFCPYMKNFSPGWNTNMKLRPRSLRRIKMVPRTQSWKLSHCFSRSLAFWQRSIFNFLESRDFLERQQPTRRWNWSECCLWLHISQPERRICIKEKVSPSSPSSSKAQVWVINGRTDQWWQNIIGEDFPDWCWKKNYRMSKECFDELAD